MSRRVTVNHLSDNLKSDTGKNVPVELIRDVYRYSDHSLKLLARRYGVSLSVIETYAREGKWDELRNLHKQKMYNILKKDRLELMEYKQDIIQRVEFYELLALEKLIEDYEKHVTQYGDPFVRKDDGSGDILRDSMGNPILRRIGLSNNDILKIKGLEGIREHNKELLNKALIEEDSNVIKIEGKTVDVNSFFDPEDK
jgi:hypothetical protein